MLGCIYPSTSAETRASWPQLGERLFFDAALSIDGKVSCASCHKPEQGFGDSMAKSTGVLGRSTLRNTPALRETNLQNTFAWDGRLATLEGQVLEPRTNPVEHGFASLDEAVRKVEAAEGYRRAFARLGARVSSAEIARALSAFVRSLEGGPSRFDRFRQGDTEALTLAEKRGLAIFSDRAACATCHRMQGPDAALTDGGYHDVYVSPLKSTGLASTAMRAAGLEAPGRARLVAEEPAIAALGRFNVTLDPRDIGKFRTPSLRNVAATAPYMHDGSIGTLEEAVDVELYHRNRGSDRPVFLTAQEKGDLIAFLRSLTRTPIDQGTRSRAH